MNELLGVSYINFNKFTQFLIWICILGAYPYIFNQILPVPPLSIWCIIIFICEWMLGCALHIKLHPLDKAFSIIFITQIVFWIIFLFLHSDYFYIERIVYMSLIYFLLLCLNTTNGLYSFFDRYDRFVMYMSIGGVIVFFMVLFFGIPHLFSFANKDGRDAFFYGLTSTNVQWGNIIRYSGYFDEPGAMAYWGIWTLIFNNLFFQNKKIEKTLMFCLVFTLSLGYYIQVFLYILCFKVRTVKQFIIISSSVLIIVGSIYCASQYYSPLYTLTFGRMEITDNGEIKGDNRSELAEKAKAEFEKSPIIGNGISRMNSLEFMAENPYETLALDGIIGTIITYLPLLYLFIYGNKNIRLSLVILGVGFLQRPFHHFLIFYFMTYSLFLLCKTQNEIPNLRCRNRRASSRIYSSHI